MGNWVNWLLVIVGVLCAVAELALGALTGFDLALVGASLAAGGAKVRVAVRERLGQLVGWLLDREGRLEGRGVNVEALVRRVLEDGGLSARYAARPVPELLAAAAAVHEELLASGAAMVTWDRFVAAFCVERGG